MIVELTDDVAAPEASRCPGGVDWLDVERALSTMPAGCRQVMILHDLQGWKHDEIAARLGIVAGTSRSQLARARRWLHGGIDRRTGSISAERGHRVD